MRTRTVPLLCGVVLAGSALACASAASPPPQPPPGEGVPVAPSVRTRPPAGQEPLVPAGFGTLKQDEITVSLRSGPLLVKVTPLEESVIRLAAPDTYDRLHKLAEGRRADAARQSASPAPALFLVSFFSYQPDVAFTPEDLQLNQQGRLLRSRAILPMTPAGWGKQRLGQQEAQMAVYAFEGGIDFDQPLVVRYGTEQSDAWGAVIRKLEEERAKVKARSGT